MRKIAAFDLDSLFEGSLLRLRTEAEYFSRLTDHNPELGRLNKSHLVKLLRDYLPPKIGVGTGFIVSGGTHLRQSPQCDIVLYDALNNAPLYKSDTWSIFPIEMVYGVIEVKTTLNNASLKEAFDKCAAIRKMCRTQDGEPNKAYALQLPPQPKTPAQFRIVHTELPPRFFVFAYDGWKKPSALERCFKEISATQQSAHVHGVCTLHKKGSMYVGHQAYGKDDDRFMPVSNNGFRQFLMSLPLSLDLMLPRERNGLGFHQVYLGHYGSLPRLSKQ